MGSLRLIGNNPGVGLRPRNTDARIDSQMFVLQGNDENIHPSDLDGEGDLNADYAVRVSKFLAAYEKTPAPAAGNGDHAFKGYEAFDPKVTLGNCGKFPASRALPIKYFPYLGQRNQVDKEVGYHSPLVAIQVDPATKGQLVHMECRAYYRGVKHDKKDKLGLVQFEVQVL